MPKPGKIPDLVRERQRAANAFVQAAALLLEYPYPSDQALAGALLHASLGLHLISKLDADTRALGLAEEHLKKLQTKP